MNKKILVIAVLGLFIMGSFGMLFFGNENNGNNSMDNMHSISNNDQENKISFSNAIGKTAPDFTLTRQDGSKFTLGNYKDKTIVLFFNEGSMCYPACWNQMASFGSDERFNNENVITVSIVIDEKNKWDQIISSKPEYGKGVILFDTTKEVSKAYDVLNLPSSMHRGSYPGHTYVIIKNDIITYTLDDPNMALNNDKLASQI